MWINVISMDNGLKTPVLNSFSLQIANDVDLLNNGAHSKCNSRTFALHPSIDPPLRSTTNCMRKKIKNPTTPLPSVLWFCSFWASHVVVEWGQWISPFKLNENKWTRCYSSPPSPLLLVYYLCTDWPNERETGYTQFLIGMFAALDSWLDCGCGSHS